MEEDYPSEREMELYGSGYNDKEAEIPYDKIKKVCRALTQASGWYGDPTCMCGADELLTPVRHKENCPVEIAEEIIKWVETDNPASV